MTIAPRQSGAAADRQSALSAGRRRQCHRLPQGVGHGDNAVAVAIALPNGRTNSGCTSAIVQIGPEGAKRPVRAIENLMTGERHLLEWNGAPFAHRSAGRSRICCSVATRRPSMNIAPAIDTNTAHKPTTTACGSRTRSSISCTSRRSRTSNGDGVGDFAGLTERLDYLRDLGVTTLWLLPFYPSPGRDDGYDISDYGDINPSFGTMKDFRRFMQEAKRRDLRVITELVVNHTSDQHDWFKRAKRSGRGTSARDWYVWSDSDQKYAGTRIIFTDTEKSNWAWDEEARRLLLAPLLLAPARLEFRQSARGQRGAAGDEALARHRRGWVPPRRRALSLRARRHQQREPAGNPRRAQAHARGARRTMRRTRCCWPKPTNGRRTCRPISATATNATWPITSR